MLAEISISSDGASIQAVLPKGAEVVSATVNGVVRPVQFSASHGQGHVLFGVAVPSAELRSKVDFRIRWTLQGGLFVTAGFLNADDGLVAECWQTSGPHHA